MWEQKPEDRVECVKTCGKVSTAQAQMVYIDYFVIAKIQALMKRYTDLEWLGYLTGHDNVVEDMYIPKQKVSGAAVNDIEGIPEIPVIGVVHSHHGMGLHSFSGVDHSYINDNHDLSILVWHNKTSGGIGINGQTRIKLPCGAVMIAPIIIEYFHPELDDAAWDTEATDNIEEKKYTYEPPAYGYGPNNDYPGHRCYTPPKTHIAALPAGGTSEKKSGGWSAKSVGRSEEPQLEKPGLLSKDTAYEAYLDQLVYDEGFADIDGLGEVCAEDLEERPPAEVEAHFRRIEEDSIAAVNRSHALVVTHNQTDVLADDSLGGGYLGVNRHKITTFQKDPDPNAPCMCRSGKMYKHCCGVEKKKSAACEPWSV